MEILFEDVVTERMGAKIIVGFVNLYIAMQSSRRL
jgi:hypothetical protein